MGRITNEVLAEKIDNLSKNLEDHIKVSNERIDGVKKEVAKNSEFRIKASGVMGVIAFVASGLGATVAVIINKFWGGN